MKSTSRSSKPTLVLRSDVAPVHFPGQAERLVEFRQALPLLVIPGGRGDLDVSDLPFHPCKRRFLRPGPRWLARFCLLGEGWWHVLAGLNANHGCLPLAKVEKMISRSARTPAQRPFEQPAKPAAIGDPFLSNRQLLRPRRLILDR